MDRKAVKKFKGLSPQQVSLSRETHGDNSLAKEKSKGFFGRFFENLSDPIIKVLIAAVVLEIVFTFGKCNLLETGGIILAVIIATTVSTASEYGSEQAFRKMQEENDAAIARVIRAQQIIEIPANELVVGDCILLRSGETVYADGVILDGNLTVDQSALNGESKDARKRPQKGGSKGDLSFEGRVYRGTYVRDGEAVALVEDVGAQTYYGAVAREVQTQTRTSPLKLRLSKLASQISMIGYFMAAIVGLTYLFFTFVVDAGFDPDRIINQMSDITFLFATLTHALTLMITVVVVAVPEGLPMMITVVLSANMKRMSKDNVMVKKLVGIETAGSMNLLFTDKTGTLTTGKTTVFGVITCDGFYKSFSALKKAEFAYKYLQIAAFSSGFSGGNSTDAALRAFFEGDRECGLEIKSQVPFSSDKKYSAVTLKDGITVVKGAPELILSHAKYSISKDGSYHRFRRDAIDSEFRERASRGERIIAFALYDPAYEGLIFISLVSLKDRLRPGAREAVEGIKKAGVQVVMITGDSKETACAVARECGIIRSASGEGVYTHDELEALNDEDLKKIIPSLRIIARALPQDKTRLVRIAQECELVVGMTGDGINDAPALKLADVGFAMGSGTDIAKGAGDIVILDNSIFAISKTILYGRTIFKSIRKFISFQLMMNLTACGVSLIGQFIGIESPITIIQMLWINIIMDTLGGLAFAGEPPLDYYMMELPKARNEKILSNEMLHQIVFTGGFTLLLSIAFLRIDFFRSLFRVGVADSVLMTGFYGLFVFAGIFNCFNSRSERMRLFSNIGKNKTFLFIMSLIAIIQVLMIYFGGDVFRTVPLTFRELLNVVLISSLVIPFDMIRRVFKKLTK